MMKVVQGTLVEFRAGATGFSVEVNGYQVYWNANEELVTKLYNNLLEALKR